MFDKKAEYRVRLFIDKDFDKEWDNYKSSFVSNTYTVHNLYKALQNILDTKVPKGSNIILYHNATSFISTWARSNNIYEILDDITQPSDYENYKESNLIIIVTDNDILIKQGHQ
jgi:hypothetical protein